MTNKTLLKTIPALSLSLSLTLASHGAMAANPPAFYVLDIRSDGNTVVHTTSARQSKADLPYVSYAGKLECCFRAGTKPGARKVVKSEDDIRSLSTEDGGDTHEFPGYLVTASGAAKVPNDTSLVFGFEGMSAVTAKGKDTYVVSFSDNAKPVVVRECASVEGINFRLYHALSDKKPFASYYFYVGFDMEPDCKP